MNDDNSNQLYDAIEENDIATASSLILSGSVNLNGESFPLLHAAALGRVEIMTLLLDAGADVNSFDEYNRTACYFAILHDQFDALKLLVDRSARLSFVNSLFSAVARNRSNERFVMLLLDAGAPIEGLSQGTLLRLVKSVAVFKRLTARNIDLTAMRDETGRSLCHYVTTNITRADDIRFLVDACGPVAVNEGDYDGVTPLHWAASSCNEAAMRILVEVGADIDQRSSEGWTALFNASTLCARPSRVEMLLALGADVRLVASGGMTVCHRAAQWCEQPAALCALVAAGGDVDQPNKKGETPRMIATCYNVALPNAREIDAARRRIAKTRLDLVRERAFQICVGLHPFGINALQLCEILMHSFGALGSLIAFHQWWAIATKVKHFRDRKQQEQLEI